MTNLELYKTAKVKLDTGELVQMNIENLLKIQNEIVESLSYEVSELKSKLTDEELESLEVF